MNKFPYKWNLKDGYPAKGIEKHGLKVFSTFACGGGSSMGYKLAGYDVIGANDIDPQMTIDIQTKYLVGMSVPPIMMAQVSYQVYIQLLSKLKK